MAIMVRLQIVMSVKCPSWGIFRGFSFTSAWCIAPSQLSRQMLHCFFHQRKESTDHVSRSVTPSSTLTHAKKKSVIILLHSRAPCSPRSIEYMLALHNTRKKNANESSTNCYFFAGSTLCLAQLFLFRFQVAQHNSHPDFFSRWDSTSLFFRHSNPLSSHPVGPRSMEWISLFSLFLTPMLPHFGNNGLSKWWFFETFFKLKLQTSNAHDTHFKLLLFSFKLWVQLAISPRDLKLRLVSIADTSCDAWVVLLKAPQLWLLVFRGSLLKLINH